MKTAIFTLMISLLTGMVQARNGGHTTDKNSMLDFYRQYSEYTDPGSFAHMYEGLPEDLAELCRLVKAQFLHPYAELPEYRDLIPRERWGEFYRDTTVALILGKLYAMDSRGFVPDRRPEDRMVMGCRDYALVLASILKSRGIPARLRSGHATYLVPDWHASHTVCEVWNADEHRWMLVDPAFAMVDFAPDKFDYSHEAWLQLQKQEIDPENYGFPGRYSGPLSILGKISPDIAFLLGAEHQVNRYAPMLENAFGEVRPLSEDQEKILYQVCELMTDLDEKNLAALREIYKNTEEIKISRTFSHGE